MLRIIVTTFGRPCSIQDPFPPQGKVVNFEPNAVTTFDAQWDQLERLGPLLDALAAKGFLTYTVAGTGGMSLTEQADSPGNPALDYATPGTVTAASIPLVIAGNRLLAGQLVSATEILGDTVAGSVVVEAVNPGAQGNLLDVEVISSGVGVLTVAVNTVSGRQVITVDLGASVAETCTTVAAIINNVVSATYGLVNAIVNGAGATPITTVRALAALTGGVGSGMQITLAGLACTVVSIDRSAAPIIVVTLATPDLTSLSLATGDKLKLEMRSGGKLTDITLIHA